jgi:hypothetical protein
MDLREVFTLVIAGGFGAVLFMVFWVVWLKTHEKAYRLLAIILGPLPPLLMILVIVGRILFTHGTVNSFETGALGPVDGSGDVLKELAFPVEQPDLEHVLDVRPSLAEVGVSGPNGEKLEVQRNEVEGMVQIRYDPQTSGTHKVVFKVPKGIERVSVVAREVR